MKIIVVNVNTSERMTEVIAEAAWRHASTGTEIVALTPFFGAEAVDSSFESYLAAVAVMDRVVTYEEPFDAVVMAGFGEYGRNGVQELVEQPVFEICEASAHIAMMLGRTYSVVTTLQRSVPADRRLLASRWFVGPLRIRPRRRYKHSSTRPRPGRVDRCNRGRGADCSRGRQSRGDLSRVRGYGRAARRDHFAVVCTHHRWRRCRRPPGRGRYRARRSDEQGLHVCHSRHQHRPCVAILPAVGAQRYSFSDRTADLGFPEGGE